MLVYVSFLFAVGVLVTRTALRVMTALNMEEIVMKTLRVNLLLKEKNTSAKIASKSSSSQKHAQSALRPGKINWKLCAIYKNTSRLIRAQKQSRMPSNQLKANLKRGTLLRWDGVGSAKNSSCAVENTVIDSTTRIVMYYVSSAVKCSKVRISNTMRSHI